MVTAESDIMEGRRIGSSRSLNGPWSSQRRDDDDDILVRWNVMVLGSTHGDGGGGGEVARRELKETFSFFTSKTRVQKAG